MDAQPLSTFEKEIKGKVRKFWVQLVAEEQKEEAVEYFRKYFARDEPICRASNLIEDEKSMEFFSNFLWNIINQNNSLACFTKLDNGEVEMVAVNICYQNSSVKTVLEKDEFQNVPDLIGRILDTLVYVAKLKETKDVGVTEYLTSIGLVVIPEYRGCSIGLHVLNARRLLCEKLGLKASCTTFTSPASQKLAEKAGFKDLVSITFDDLEKMRPSAKFPNINKYSKCMRHMFILYE